MSKEHETDIYYFKKVYRYLTEERGKKMSDVVTESGLHCPLVKKLIGCSKDTIPNMRASTWGMLQDFVKKYKVHVAEVEYVGVLNEGIEHLIEENGKGHNVEEKDAQPRTIGEADTFDLLRALSHDPKVQMNISISLGKSESL